MRQEHPPEVALPGGLVAESGRRLTRVVLRPLSGREEEWLARHSDVANAVAVTHVLGACLVRADGEAPPAELARRLLAGDRDYLILQLRRLTVGDRIDAVLTCPACPAKMDVTFDAGAIPVEPRPQNTASYTLRLPEPGSSDRAVRFRLPTGADQEAVLGVDGPAAVDALLDRCIVDDGGVGLAPEERRAVTEAMDELSPQLEIELDLTCPECGHAFLAPFDATSYFLCEMRVSGRQLLREVHALAFYYHWSEADILGLTRDRRRAYLELLNDALIPD